MQYDSALQKEMTYFLHNYFFLCSKYSHKQKQTINVSVCHKTSECQWCSCMEPQRTTVFHSSSTWKISYERYLQCPQPLNRGLTKSWKYFCLADRDEIFQMFLSPWSVPVPVVHVLLFYTPAAEKLKTKLKVYI